MLPLLLQRTRDAAQPWFDQPRSATPRCLEKSVAFYLRAFVLILQVEPCLQRWAKGEEEASREPHLRGVRPPEHGKTHGVPCLHTLNRNTHSPRAVKQLLLFLLEVSHLYDY